MYQFYKIILSLFVLFLSIKLSAQNHSKMIVALNPELKTLTVNQVIEFTKLSNDTLDSVVLNDWNNGFSNKNSPLAKRFSDEFYSGFHFSKEEERAETRNLILLDENQLSIPWERSKENPDCIVVKLPKKGNPNQKIILNLTYISKIPSDRFTKYGYGNSGDFNLKNIFLIPARYENHAFIKYDNYNLDDSANSISDFDIQFKIPENLAITSDLNCTILEQKEGFKTYHLSGENKTDFNITIEPKSSFTSFQSESNTIVTNLKGVDLSEIQKGILISNVLHFVKTFLGENSQDKIMVSQVDYDRNPFYGLNQLPAFLSPFSNEFIYEINFLKTYLNAYLKTNLHLDPRKDNWIYDGIQVFTMMKYIEENHPNEKMVGSISRYKLLNNFHLTTANFNEQYSYFHLLMARKNLDQSLGLSKDKLLKFNEQIANKYRAGLSFRYLDQYLNDNIFGESISEFLIQNKNKECSRTDFETLIKSKTPKNISWFFNTIIDSRDLIDYKFSKVTKTKDSITFSIKNKTGVLVPVPIFGLKKGEVVFKKWLNANEIDSTFTLERKNADKIVLNFNNEVPEFNLRNNWKSLNQFSITNRPIKFNFMKDLEDPHYNQILYVPTLTYNLYDGFSPGLYLHNRTILDKPFDFDINPSYSTTAKNLSGLANFTFNQNYRNGSLYTIRYSVSGSYFHYAADASYLKINPMIQFRIRDKNFRDNRKQVVQFRQVMVNREKSAFAIDKSTENYSVFDAKYISTRTEITKHFNFISDIQIADKFGKIALEMGYRKLFNNNHRINLRIYAGHFLYNNSNSDFFSFALDRPTDYLFDYDYYGRSESSGIFSQQYIATEGGFKSKLSPSYANEWITTCNGSFSIWNSLEVYGDAGFVKNRNQKEKFVFDSGIRINLVPDYFELYFPVYSNKGWEIVQNKYSDKIRFVVTFSPKTLITLFNRKWF